ncbi:MAG: NPCBM/NEW2 domain-containing protein [Planctomycetota bacterium]|nr:NPCBM/NEW2 domain-containing protein [Planctomycetota bacterium]
MSRIIQISLFVGWIVPAIPPAHADYQVVFRDGSIAVTGRLGEIDDSDRDVRVAGKSLFGPRALVRMIRSLHVEVAREGPFLELANGDVLRGRVRGYLPGPAPRFDRVLVDLADAALVEDSIRLEIRPEYIVRICARPSPRERSPGTLLLIDGRRLSAKSLRWSNDGISVLTSGGILLADFDQIADLTLPKVDRNSCLLADARLARSADAANSPLIVSASTVGGSRITFPRAMSETVKLRTLSAEGRRPIETLRHVIAVRPMWSYSTLLVDPLMIACRTYRLATEFPLSAMPAELVQQQTAIQNLGWARNQNVLEQPLHVGEVIHEYGIGSHSEVAVAFDLPAYAASVSLHVGLDRTVAQGGCVRCAVRNDRIDNSPTWRSGFMTGASEPQATGDLDVRGVRRLLLMTEFAHQDRPAGSDPLDIRDFVDWVQPWVTIDPKAIGDGLGVDESISALNGWQLTDESRRQAVVAPAIAVLEKSSQWKFALRPRTQQVQSLELTRRFTVSDENAMLRVEAIRTDRAAGAVVSLRIDGEPLIDRTNRDFRPVQNQPTSREWNLGAFVGKTVTLSLVMSVESQKQPLSGIVWTSIDP